MRATMVTTTTYGTWLPGDLRGYVQDGRILPGDPRLLTYARDHLAHDPVYLTQDEQTRARKALLDAAAEFGYHLSDASIDTWHLHIIVAHPDNVAELVGRLKTRMRQALTRGRLWTEGYCHRPLTMERDVQAARRYIADHPGCWLIEGLPWPREMGVHGQPPPGRAGG